MMRGRKTLITGMLVLSLLLNAMPFFPSAAQAAPAAPMLGPNPVPVDIVDDFEDGELPSGTDGDGVDIGFITWSGGSSVSIITTTVPAGDPLALPNQTLTNTVIQLDTDVGSGGYAGFTHAFENEAVDTWVPQDWSDYTGIALWIYGNNTGGTIFVDVLDNRNPGSTTDDAERYSIDLVDDFSGWKYFELPFTSFSRKDIGNGAPNDGFTLTQVHGWAVGVYGSVAMGAQTNYVDNVGLMKRVTVVDDFEDGELPSGTDGDGNAIGFVTWGDGPVSITTTLVADTSPISLPHQTGDNTLLQVDYDVPGYGGFTHAFENAALDTWTPQDWSGYEGIAFWLYGTDTGGNVNIDIFDNRSPGSTTDDAERFTYIFADDFAGWRYFELPFTDFSRKIWQPGGAPDDGLTLSQVHGYAFGFPAGVGAQTSYVDNVFIYGDTGAGDLEVQFSAGSYTARENTDAAIAVTLGITSTDTISVTYTATAQTATEGRDYTATAGTLVFPPGSDEQTFTVPLLDDVKYEGEETVLLTLSTPINAELGPRSEAVLKIQDNDPYDRGLIDDFEGPLPPLETWGDVTLATEEITAGMAMSLPTQGTYETVLAASYDIGAGETGGFMRPFFDAQDWSDFQGVDLWYYGANSGEDVTVTLYDNEAPDPGPSSWELVWSDEFNGAAGAAPDPTKWGYDIGGWGWGNNERQYYTDLRSNSAQDGNGSLVITATTENTATTTYDCHYGPCEYTSARLLTQDKFEFAYGRVEGRLKIPYSQGVWPAFWSLGANFEEVSWPTCGEIDIMENIGREPTTTHGTVHGPGYAGGSGIGGSYTQTLPFHEDYHVFAIEWEPEEIRWYVDGNHFFTVTPDDLPSGTDWVFDHPFFLIMNIAVGGYWPGYPDETTVMPQTMHIDYVRVYQAPQSAERFEATFTDDATGWQHVMLPFDAFSRSATQPDGAPDDGLTLTAMQGYALELPEGSDTAYVDQVHLFGKHPLLDDYESGWSSEYVVWGDFEWNPGTTTALTPTLATFGPTDAMALPYQTYTNTVLQLDYVVAPGQYGGFSRAYEVFEDWSHHDTFNFWFYGLNTGGEFYVDIFDNRNHDVPGDTAERFTATFTDDVAGWRYIQLPFGDFTRKGWQPGGAPNDGLTLTEVWGFGFGLPAGTQGTIYLDEFVLQDTADLIVEKARVGTGDVTGGDRVTYTLSIANLGPTTPVTGTVVDTWTPVDAVTAVAAPPECTVELAAGKVTCTYAELDTAYLPKMLVFTTEARFSGELVNTASIEPLGDVVDVRPENDTSSVTVTVLFGGGDLYLPLVMRDYGP